MIWSVYRGIVAIPSEFVRFHAFAPLAWRLRYHRVRAVGVVVRPLSGYWAVVLLGLRDDQIVAPAIGMPLESTTVAWSHRRKLTVPPAAVGRKAGCQSEREAGSWVRSIVTLYRYAFDVPSTRSSLWWPGVRASEA